MGMLSSVASGGATESVTLLYGGEWHALLADQSKEALIELGEGVDVAKGAS